MDSELAIKTIEESCYRIGYPTHDAEHKRRILINNSCDFAIECIEKLDKIERIFKSWAEIGEDADIWAFRKIREVLENG